MVVFVVRPPFNLLCYRFSYSEIEISAELLKRYSVKNYTANYLLAQIEIKTQYENPSVEASISALV